MQLRKRYDTRSTHPAHPHSRIPNKLPIHKHNNSKSPEVFYSDEEHPSPESSKAGLSSKKVHAVNQEASPPSKSQEQPTSDPDSKNWSMAKNSKNNRPPRKTRKCKKTRGLHSRPKHKEDFSRDSDSKVNASVINENSQQLQSSRTQKTQTPQSQQLKPPELRLSEGENACRESRMVDEKEESPKNATGRLERQREQVEQKMRLLAKMNFNPDNNLKCPFEVLSQYRSSFEKSLKCDYRDYLKIQQIKQHNPVQQKISFQMLRENESQRQYSQSNNSQEWEVNSGSGDLLFERCKDMNKEQQLEFLKGHFQQLIQLETERKKDALLKDLQLSRTKKLNIANTINEVVIISPEGSQKPAAPRVPRASENNSTRIGTVSKEQAHFEAIKIEGHTALQSHSYMPSSNTHVPSSVSPEKQVKLQQLQQYRMEKSDLSEQSKLQEKIWKKKIRAEPAIKPKATEESNLLQAADKKDNREIKSYNRNKILAQINLINRKCAQAEKQNQFDEEKKETSRTNSAHSVRSIHGELFRDKSDILSFQMEPLKNEGFGEIEIRTPQISEKTEQRTRPDHLSFESKDSYKDNEGSGTVWSGFSRGGPKVKRLEILNRYHYNPFEETNGEDQCELWKRLMSDEVQDIKSYYKFQDANEYDCLFNQFDRLDKGNSVILKVCEQDFFVNNYYDPIGKCLMEDVPFQPLLKGENRNEDSEHVTEIDRYLFPNRKESFLADKKSDDDDFDIRKSYAAYQQKMKNMRASYASQLSSEMRSESSFSEEAKQGRGLAQIKEESQQAEQSIEKSFERPFHFSQLQDLDVCIKKEGVQGERPEIHMTEIHGSMGKQNSKEDQFDII